MLGLVGVVVLARLATDGLGLFRVSGEGVAVGVVVFLLRWIMETLMRLEGGGADPPSDLLLFDGSGELKLGLGLACEVVVVLGSLGLASWSSLDMEAAIADLPALPARLPLGVFDLDEDMELRPEAAMWLVMVGMRSVRRRCAEEPPPEEDGENDWDMKSSPEIR